MEYLDFLDLGALTC